MTAPLPTELYTAAQSRELDALQIAAGVSGFTLMQRAAQAAWQAMHRRWTQVNAVTVLTGAGNNGGDGYLIACMAQRAGWQVQVLTVVDPQQLQGDAALAFQEAQAAGISIRLWHPEEPLRGVVVDALLGTGISGSLRSPYVEVITAINASGLPVLAVDLPSGLCADTGQVLSVAVRAELTVCLIGLKVGLFTGQGADYVGTLVFDDLQLDPSVRAQVIPTAYRLDRTLLPQIPPRKPTAHKGDFGHLLVIGGDLGTGGAALMAAEAGLRTGAGMVTLATRPEHLTAALVRRPEVMCIGMESSYLLESVMERVTVAVVGPGLGQGPWGRSLLSLIAHQAVPQVWDADALNLLAAGAAWIPAGSLITPHPGEAARLLDCSIGEVQANRPAAVRLLARHYDCVAILKGAGTLIAAPDGRLMLCDQGHPAMAAPGLGDVLAGVLGALMGQGLPAFEAACLGVWLHASAGAQAGLLGRGVAATDLIPLIRHGLEEHSPCRS